MREVVRLMSETLREIKEMTDASYEYGFSTDLETDIAPPGLTEDTVRLISAKKDEPEWLRW
jgi:Fe-S cluster assembly protein SufB